MRLVLSCGEILRGARVGDKTMDILAQTHHVFWFGDMNYRTDFGLPKEENKQQAFQLVELQDWKALADGDELVRELAKYVSLQHPSTAEFLFDVHVGWWCLADLDQPPNPSWI